MRLAKTFASNSGGGGRRRRGLALFVELELRELLMCGLVEGGVHDGGRELVFEPPSRMRVHRPESKNKGSRDSRCTYLHTLLF